MVHNHEMTPKLGRGWNTLATKFLAALTLAAIVVLLLGWLNWQALRDVRQAAAVDDALLARIDSAAVFTAAGVGFGLVLLACIYFYLVRAVVRPLQADVRILYRLADGDAGVDAPVDQAARNDEIGDLARAINGAIARRRRETKLANEISAGDFSGLAAAPNPSDELGLALRHMAGATVETLRRVNAHMAQVMTGCEAIVSAGEILSANSADISGAMTSASPEIVRVKTRADDNTGLVDKAAGLANTSILSIDRGYTDVGEMGMVMLNMQACGDKIVQLAKSISDIAFQTNLLSLNASVEAARAGRHGKGFTIVAEEVRNLAVRTSKAAEETSTLMKDTVEQVELAAAIAGRINATFSEMQDNIREADTLLGKIAVASREQSSGMDMISDALRQADQSARENRERVGGVLKQADGLAGQAGRLRNALGIIRLDHHIHPHHAAMIENNLTPAIQGD